MIFGAFVFKRFHRVAVKKLNKQASYYGFGTLKDPAKNLEVYIPSFYGF